MPGQLTERPIVGPTYKDKNGKTVAVTTGLGNTYIVARMKANGSASRVKSDRLYPVEGVVEAGRHLVPALERYAKQHGWTRVEDETLPAKTAPEDKSAIVAHLDEAATAINAEYANWQRHDREANLSMLRLGVMMEIVNSMLPHGQWEKWREEHVSVSRRHSYNFRQIARHFIETRQIEAEEARLLIGADAGTDEAETFEQMAFEFLGERTQAELLKASQKRRGGDHGGGEASKRMAAERHQAEILQAREQFELIVTYMREFALERKRYVHVDPDVLAAGKESIKECLRAIKQ